MKKYKLLIVTGIIIIVIALISITGSAYLESRIKNELQGRQVGSFHAQAGEVSIKPFLRQLIIEDISLQDSAADRKISVQNATAKGIHIFQLIFKSKIIVNRLILENPEVTLNQSSSEDKAESTDNPQPGKEDEDMKEVVLKKLELSNAKLLIENANDSETDTILFSSAGLEIWNLNIGNETELLKYKGNSAQRLRLVADNSIVYFPGNLYKIETSDITMDSQTHELNMIGLHLSTLLAKDEVGPLKGVQTEWYDIRAKQLQFQGIDLIALLSDSAIVFRKAVVESLEAHIYKDKRLPFPDKPDTRLPMAMLDNLPLLVHSDSILVTKSNVVYEEHAEESYDPGHVSFNELYATIYNFSTLPDSIKGPSAMSARAMVMNEALLDAEFIFPNKVHPLQYKATGNLAPVDFTVFNTMVVPSAFVRIDEGQLINLNFEFTYDDLKSDGSLKMEYENINVALLDKEDESEKKIKTFITETFVLKRNNKKEDNLYQEGTISFERNRKKSIFNYWWKSLFSGIKDILAF